MKQHLHFALILPKLSFKIVNRKGKDADVRHDDREGVTSDPSDERLTFLTNLGDAAPKIKKVGQVPVETGRWCNTLHSKN